MELLNLEEKILRKGHTINSQSVMNYNLGLLRGRKTVEAMNDKKGEKLAL